MALAKVSLRRFHYDARSGSRKKQSLRGVHRPLASEADAADLFGGRHRERSSPIITREKKCYRVARIPPVRKPTSTMHFQLVDEDRPIELSF